LAAADAVLATRGNLNNDIGLPLTLLGLRDTHRAAVIEMGMNHSGEIDYLTRLAAPTVALVNNAQRAHLEGMGTRAGCGAGQGRDLRWPAASGVAVINADDPQAGIWRELSRDCRQVGFGLDQAGRRARQVRARGLGGAALETPWGARTRPRRARRPQRAQCLRRRRGDAGRGRLAGGAVKQGLEAFAGIKGRLQRRAGRNGALVIDDSYNANPDSVRAAIDVLAAIPGKRIFVMGDMGEAGAAAGQFHDEIGGYAKSRGIDRLLCLGDLSVAATHNFGAGGQHFARIEDLLKALRGELDEHTTVLVKGSRFMKMERVADEIVEKA
jgi:UDP-N-acetylmuramoyl-tripeptide--D-alanyl-D-alanine ligase